VFAFGSIVRLHRDGRKSSCAALAKAGPAGISIVGSKEV